MIFCPVSLIFLLMNKEIAESPAWHPKDYQTVDFKMEHSYIAKLCKDWIKRNLIPTDIYTQAQFNLILEQNVNILIRVRITCENLQWLLKHKKVFTKFENPFTTWTIKIPSTLSESSFLGNTTPRHFPFKPI